MEANILINETCSQQNDYNKNEYKAREFQYRITFWAIYG